jgi:hypothetical protein
VKRESALAVAVLIEYVLKVGCVSDAVTIRINASVVAPVIAFFSVIPRMPFLGGVVFFADTTAKLLRVIDKAVVTNLDARRNITLIFDIFKPEKQSLLVASNIFVCYGICRTVICGS